MYEQTFYLLIGFHIINISSMPLTNSFVLIAPISPFILNVLLIDPGGQSRT